MNLHFSKCSEIKFLSLALLLLFVCAAADAADDECQGSGGYGFVCGPQNAEDLVLVPGTRWILSSGMAPGTAILLIDSQTKNWTELYPADMPRAQQNMETYGACPGSPDPNNFITHGLNLRPGENGHSTLYVVGHGGREAIEVFDVNASGAKPVMTWTGCVMLPEGMAANSVASFSDGSLLVTVPLHPGKTIEDAFAGDLTGAVYQWSPGDSGFEMVHGTELPYANGIEVSADEQEFYVVSSVLYTVVAYSRSNPSRQLRSTRPMAFVPDNVHMGSDGSLITAGMVIDDPICGSVQNSEEFDLEEFAACPRPFIAKAIDPQSMEGRDLVRGPANEHFSNATMALQVGSDIWIGTFSGDRIGYRSLKQHD
jgi:sugar lactone lactonase YvrE